MDVKTRFSRDIRLCLGLPPLTQKEVDASPHYSMVMSMLREPLKDMNIPTAWKFLFGSRDSAVPWNFISARRIARLIYPDQFPRPTDEELNQLVDSCQKRVLDGNLPCQDLHQRWKILMKEAKSTLSSESYKLLQLYRQR